MVAKVSAHAPGSGAMVARTAVLARESVHMYRSMEIRRRITEQLGAAVGLASLVAHVTAYSRNRAQCQPPASASFTDVMVVCAG
ncbi:hypothetical protein GCM10017674_60560 [Streptomyces gardneri]|uniref:Uncharacterized protein n=1 Tax=Streptomyces gardneri TaxID=66892 RepID=A0A4Y3RHV9_9ACTN|nr:hypothetical protein SGA01_28670 [Streptomyces gardneri]GHH13374.1 hypothetical protein GCM10017674_60560 [Streptomyces gardneri]